MPQNDSTTRATAPEELLGNTLGFRPQLDTLRAIAVFGVLYGHLWETSSHLGTLGVRLFFVLSGFLITSLLLPMRDQNTGRSRLTNFYVRRALRIWPIYYLCLFAAIVANIQDIRQVAVWHLLFLSNILFALRDQYVPWVTSPWWSLAVEEQFYLIWPIIVLVLPRHLLGWVTLGLVVSGVGFHFTVDRLSYWKLGGYHLPPACFEPLGAGAMLAIAKYESGSFPRWVVPVGVVTAPVVAYLQYTGQFGWQWDCLNVLPMMAAVAAATDGVDGFAGRVLSFAPLRFLGRISFGLYLYHTFALLLLFRLSRFMPEFGAKGPVVFVTATILTVGMASLSWNVVERRANRLKRYFP